MSNTKVCISPFKVMINPNLFCRDGFSQSAVFHVICDVISRMTSDQEIDMYTAVRNVQAVRPQCFNSDVQYRFLYTVIQEYRRGNNIYANA